MKGGVLNNDPLSFSSSLYIHNHTAEDLICLLHKSTDKLQLLTSQKYKISSNNSLLIDLQQGNEEEVDDLFYLHIYRPGLFGYISLRTRLTSGYGFPVETGNRYNIFPLQKADIHGNHCSLQRQMNGNNYENVRSIKYHFGDMFLKPSLRALASIFQIPSIDFDPDIYHDYLLERNGRHLSIHEEPDHSYLESIVTPTEVLERELWGIFFDQMYYVGIWAIHDVSYITVDEVELQEPYLYIGLPSVSLLNMILRSRYDSSPATLSYLRLIDGRVVSETTCPESYRVMFQILLQTKQEMCRLEPAIQLEEMDWLRETFLYSGSDKSLQGFYFFDFFIFIFLY